MPSDLRALVPAVQAVHSLCAVQAVHPVMAVLQSTSTGKYTIENNIFLIPRLILMTQVIIKAQFFNNLDIYPLKEQTK